MPVQTEVRIFIGDRVEPTVYPYPGSGVNTPYPLYGTYLLAEVKYTADALAKAADVLRRFVEAGWDLEGYEDGWQREAVLQHDFVDEEAAVQAIHTAVSKDFYYVSPIGISIDGEEINIDPPDGFEPPKPSSSNLGPPPKRT